MDVTALEKHPVAKPEFNRGSEKTSRNVSYRFYFSPHITNMDIPGLAQEIANCDIFVPEKPIGYTQLFIDNLREISAGNKAPDEFIQEMQNDSPSNGFYSQLASDLY